MKSKKYDLIKKRILETIDNRQADSLLQKLEFEYHIKTKEEFSNYILIILVLMENSTYYSSSSNLLLRKILKNISFSFIEDKCEPFEIIKDNKVLPYVGLSETVRRLISSIIFQDDIDKDIMANWPSKEYLTNFNVELLEDYVKSIEIDMGIATTLLYGCIKDIQLDRKIFLDDKAIFIFKNVLIHHQGALNGYLRKFIRFKYLSSSRNWDEGKLIVPEPFYEQIFGSVAELQKVISEHVLKFEINTEVDKIYLEIGKFMEIYSETGKVNYDTLNLTLEIHDNIKPEIE